MMDEINALKIDAARIRLGVLKGLAPSGSGHIGGCMSMAELMAVLYGRVMDVRPTEPQWTDRDWLIVSKGHCGPAVYSALALHGFFPKKLLKTINQDGTSLPSHCDRNKTPGIDMSTGSLGQGMSTAIGVAWGNRYQGKKSDVFLLLGDGECQEGQVWEGALFAAQHKQANLIAFIDNNKKQLDGYTEDICALGDVGAKFREFGWHVQDCDGHDVNNIICCVTLARSERIRPSLIVLHTEKGRGCTFAQDILFNHHMKFSDLEYEEAVTTLEAEISRLEKGG